MEEKINEAINYANASNSLENNGLSIDETRKIFDDIMKCKTDQSFLYSLVEEIKRKEEKNSESKKNEVKSYGKNR